MSGEWDENRPRRQLKKIHPKDIRGEYDDDLPLNDARRENQELRKRLARRMRRNGKRELIENLGKVERES
jgi:hypothetical protein